MRAGAMLMIVAVLTTACVTKPAGKPVLTASALKSVAAACGANDTKFTARKNKLPFASVNYREPGQPSSGLHPIVVCLTQGIRPYAYDFLGFRNLDEPTEQTPVVD